MAIPGRLIKPIREGHYTLIVTSVALHKLKALVDVFLEKQASEPISGTAVPCASAMSHKTQLKGESYMNLRALLLHVQDAFSEDRARPMWGCLG